MRQQTQPTVTSNSLFSWIREGLTRPGQKELPSRFLYDEVGSALFEAISVLPEYGLSRADVRLLRGNAPKIVSRLPLPVIVAELGTGSGKKTRWLLEALARRRPSCVTALSRFHAVRWPPGPLPAFHQHQSPRY